MLAYRRPTGKHLSVLDYNELVATLDCYTSKPSEEIFEEAKIAYYTSTIRGAQAGDWNLNVSKQLDIDWSAGGVD